MKKRNLKGNNKGFTLVELIVVLVILAILAAILVPALLGYIDSARNKQTLLNARSAMTAAQAELSAIYGSKSGAPGDIESGVHNKNLLATMDQPSLSCNSLVIGCKAEYKDPSISTNPPKKDQHDAFTVSYVEYTDATGEAYYVDGEWLDTLDAKPACAKTYYVVYGSGKF